MEWKGRKFREKAARFRFGAREEGGEGEKLERGEARRGTTHREGEGRTAQGMIGVEEGDDGTGARAGARQGGRKEVIFKTPLLPSTTDSGVSRVTTRPRSLALELKSKLPHPPFRDGNPFQTE